MVYKAHRTTRTSQFTVELSSFKMMKVETLPIKTIEPSFQTHEHTPGPLGYPPAPTHPPLSLPPSCFTPDNSGQIPVPVPLAYAVG